MGQIQLDIHSLRLYEETVIYKFEMRTAVLMVCVLIMAGILQSSADRGLWCTRFPKKCTELCGPSRQCTSRTIDSKSWVKTTIPCDDQKGCWCWYNKKTNPYGCKTPAPQCTKVVPKCTELCGRSGQCTSRNIDSKSWVKT